MEIKNLIKAVLNVMSEVKNIDKNMTVGEGTKMAYKAVSDKDVKSIIGESMRNNGLVIFPIKIEPLTKIETWSEKTNYGDKMKQSVFTEVKTTYLLAHESGESIEIQGYGHGIDSQDKSSGKATTYALKYALLYQFLIPTGAIDDTDLTHSETKEIKPKENFENEVIEIIWLTEEQYKKALQSDIKGIEATLKTYSTSEKRMKKKYRENLELQLKALKSTTPKN